MICVFENGSHVCSVCGVHSPWPDVPRTCVTPQRLGLGDIVASGLAAVGITKERVSAVVGGPCGCEERQEQLNALGRRLGIGQ